MSFTSVKVRRCCWLRNTNSNESCQALIFVKGIHRSDLFFRFPLDKPHAALLLTSQLKGVRDHKMQRSLLTIYSPVFPPLILWLLCDEWGFSPGGDSLPALYTSQLVLSACFFLVVSLKKKEKKKNNVKVLSSFLETGLHSVLIWVLLCSSYDFRRR